MPIVFCLPGNSFSGRALECWTRLLCWCFNNGINPVLSRQESCNIYYVRNMCLGGDVRRGAEQLPFDGKLKYDYLMWIDSDVLYAPEDFNALLKHAELRGFDIVSGVYAMAGSGEFATVEKWDENFFRANGHFKFLSPDDAAKCSRPFPVAYTGMGFMLVKYGVFESLSYPWFRAIEKKIDDMVDFTMEDVAFCQRALHAGYRIMVDPKIRVGHEKKTVL